jgi:hypothetical protein
MEHLKETLLYAAAVLLYQAAQLFFNASQKEHRKTCPHHAAREEKFRRYREDRMN